MPIDRVTVIDSPSLEGLAFDPSDLDRYALVLAPDYNGDGWIATVLANGAPVLALTFEDGDDPDLTLDRAHLLIPEGDRSGYAAQAAAGLLTRIGHVGEDFGALVAEVGWDAAWEQAAESDGIDKADLWVEDGHAWVAFLAEVQDYADSYAAS